MSNAPKGLAPAGNWPTGINCRLSFLSFITLAALFVQSSRPRRSTPSSTYTMPSGAADEDCGNCEEVEAFGSPVAAGEGVAFVAVVSTFSLPLPRNHAPATANKSSNAPTPINNGVRDLA